MEPTSQVQNKSASPCWELNSQHSSYTNSAHRNSHKMLSIQNSLINADEVDISGLVESAVDSDEEDLAENMDSLKVRDTVRDCLEKDPVERTVEDIETLLEFTQGLKAFANTTLAIRRELCSVMVFAVVDKAGTTVMSDGEEHDSWSVLINGHVEIEHHNDEKEELQVGDSFGILPIMDKLYNRGVMRTKCDDCQFVCITQADYYRIQHQGEENIRRYEDEEGQIVMVTEMRQIGGNDHNAARQTSATALKRGQVVIRGTIERLLLQLIEENSVTDPTYVEDFLLTHRIFIRNQHYVMQKLIQWYEKGCELEQDIVATAQGICDRVTRVILLWVNNHFIDFESDYEMMGFLELFEGILEHNKMLIQQCLLNKMCTKKAHLRSVTLARSSRNERLRFQIIGGFEMQTLTKKTTGGIFIAHVDDDTKAQDIGLIRGDQILEVNGQSLEYVTSKRAMELLMASTHISITVKSNLLAFKEMVVAIENAKSSRSNSTSLGGSFIVRSLQGTPDSKEDSENRSNIARLHSVDLLQTQPKLLSTVTDVDCCQTVTQHVSKVRDRSSHQSVGSIASHFVNNILQSSSMASNNDALSLQNKVGCEQNKPSGGSFMALGPKRRIQKALMKMNLLQKSTGSYPVSHTKSGSFQSSTIPDQLDTTIGTAPSNQQQTTPTTCINSMYQSQSNPDLTSMCFDETTQLATVPTPQSTTTPGTSHVAPIQENPEHVLKIYRADQTCKYVLISKETTAHEVIMLALQEFDIHDTSSNFSLCEVSVGEGGMVKQRRLPDQLQNLAERITLSARYYLRTNGSTETLVSDELALELVRECTVHFLQLNAYELSIQLTLEDFAIFRQIEPTEYIDDLFELNSKYGAPKLMKFATLINREMFWVVSEICSEHNIVRRMKIIKQFIKIARHCKEMRNFNSMFAIVSGLGHAAVSRLRQTWDKVPSKYELLFSDLQDLMDPSRNMSKYRQLVLAELVSQQPIIPFYPVVKKDLTFIHLGNDTYAENLINFEKMRMIAKEVRTLKQMCSTMYDFLTLMKSKDGQQASLAILVLNQMSGTNGAQLSQQAKSSGNSIGISTGHGTLKRRKKSTAAPNPKKMFEEAQMIRRVKSYLSNLKITSDEDLLHKLSLECEPAAQHFCAQYANTNTSSLSASLSHSSADQVSIHSQIASSSCVPISTLSQRKRHPSPTLSTTSSTSSTSEQNQKLNKNSVVGCKYGTASPRTVKKMLSLSEPMKIRTNQPYRASIALPLTQHVFNAHGLGTGTSSFLTPSSPECRSISPNSHRRMASGSNAQGTSSPFFGRSIHERSNSDTPTPLQSVDHSTENKGVTTFSNFPLRKSCMSGSATSSDSGHGSYAQHDSYSVGSATESVNLINRGSCQYSTNTVFNSLTVKLSSTSSTDQQCNVLSPILQPRRRHSSIQGGNSTASTQLANPQKGPAAKELRCPPNYSVAANLAHLQRIGRAHSFEGVTGIQKYNTNDS